MVSENRGLTVYCPAIVVSPSANTLDRLDTFIHEALHAASPKLTEREVRRIAGDLAAVLWRAGYRHQRTGAQLAAAAKREH